MVNTFLPFPDFRLSARVLDWKRLGKQRVEAMQIVNMLSGTATKTGWKNHPAVHAWKDNLDALKLYHNAIVKEWIARGYVNNMVLYEVDESNVKMPWWFGTYSFHISHQSNLMRKDENYYKEYFDLKKDQYNLPYVWPSKVSDEEKETMKREIMKITVLEE